MNRLSKGDFLNLTRTCIRVIIHIDGKKKGLLRDEHKSIFL